MRVSAFTLISIVASLATYVAAHSESTYDARELVDEFATRNLEAFDYALERREILDDLSTRDLIDELSDRLERRAGEKLQKGFKCPYCGKNYKNEADAKHCATNPQMLGGCKVNNAVVQGGTARSRSPSPSRRR
ncbi:hypothetical protein DFP72DRAFT_83008 [Ephemerocybe angulata]|uniref:C2H2-type domain-containing protein n=1 Tax=Ephemerocybe angulata TaxID=980116 RepID=A0A8H6LW58_9AGAR|nr:hypothetical protein DFP72DRAFT_83008 [Tulosesus angulatus]